MMIHGLEDLPASEARLVADLLAEIAERNGRYVRRLDHVLNRGVEYSIECIPAPQSNVAFLPVRGQWHPNAPPPAA